jgi:hypothetical protein
MTTQSTPLISRRLGAMLMENRVILAEERLGQLTFLVQTFGAHAVSPRFDPIVHYRNLVGGTLVAVWGVGKCHCCLLKGPAGRTWRLLSFCCSVVSLKFSLRCWFGYVWFP